MNQTYIELQLKTLIALLGSPVGLVGLLILPIAAILIASRPIIRWSGLATLLWVVSLNNPVIPGTIESIRMVLPLGALAAHGRIYVIMGMLCLLFAALKSEAGWRFTQASKSLKWFVLVQLIFSVRIALSDDLLKGVGAIVLVILMFLIMGVGISRWLQEGVDMVACLRAFVVTACLFIAGTLLQLKADYFSIIIQDRLMATAGNPQAAMLVIIVLLPPTLALLLYQRERTTIRIVSGLVAACLLTMLIWTGSRTGTIVALVEIAVLFRLRMGRLFLGVVVAAIMLLLMLRLMPASMAGSERMISLDDTRSDNWMAMLRDFSRSPIWGVPSRQSTASSEESSYLRFAARLGLIGLVPLAIMFYHLAREMRDVLSIRRSMTEDSVLADTTISGIIGLLVAAIFEAILTGSLTISLFAFYIYVGFATFLRDWHLRCQTEADDIEEPDSPEDLLAHVA